MTYSNRGYSLQLRLRTSSILHLTVLLQTAYLHKLGCFYLAAITRTVPYGFKNIIVVNPMFTLLWVHQKFAVKFTVKS